jgi:hypothetical protein
VRTQVVLDTLVGGLVEAAAERLQAPLEARVEAALARCGEPRAARAGYLARALELERFAPARAPMPWLRDRMREAARPGREWSATAAAVAMELAAGEPEGRPGPDDERAVSWRVPGPGGHVRYYVARRAAHDDHGRRAWLAGFLIHCCVEVT